MSLSPSLLSSEFKVRFQRQKNLNITIISFLLLQYVVVGLCKTSGAGTNKRTDHALFLWGAALNSLPTEIFTTGLGRHVYLGAVWCLPEVVG